MKTLLRFVRVLVPIVAVLGILTSCDKEECCTWIDSFGDRYMYCEDDARWQAWYNSWNEVRAYAMYYGGSCK